MVECKGPNIERAKRDKVSKPLLSEISGKLGLKIVQYNIQVTMKSVVIVWCVNFFVFIVKEIRYLPGSLIQENWFVYFMNDE